MQVFLVRHGETLWNLQGRMQGFSDSPLTDVGIAQAAALAESLKNHSFSIIYSSDLSRAAQTAEQVALRQGKQVFLDTRLREKNLGIFQGLTQSEIAQQFPQEYTLYKTNKADYVVPQGESGKQFFDRTISFFKELPEKHVSGSCILVVAHGGVLTNFFKYTQGIPLETPRHFTILNTSLNVFSYKENHWLLERWGDLSHLSYLRSLDDT